jgi:hypothetical protein
MQAVSNRTGKVFKGKLAGLMVRIGSARPIESETKENDPGDIQNLLIQKPTEQKPKGRPKSK